MTYNAKKIEELFRNAASVRIAQKRSGDSRYIGDAGYRDGGRCEYGGAHNLQEDCEELAKFFNSIANISEDIDKIRLSANEEVFNSNKQQLISKLQGLIGKCQVTSATSVGGICII